MATKVEIIYVVDEIVFDRALQQSTERAEYRLLIDVRDITLLKVFADRENLGEKTPREVISALLMKADFLLSSELTRNKRLHDGPDGEAGYRKFNADGKLIYDAHYQDGEYNDGIHGDPAFRFIHENGQTVELGRYKKGRLQDGLKGESALQKFTLDGKLVEQSRHQNGLRTDGTNGEAAYQKFNAAGSSLTVEEHWKDSKRHDGIHGEPAIRHFDGTGKIIFEARYDNDRFIPPALVDRKSSVEKTEAEIAEDMADEARRKYHEEISAAMGKNVRITFRR